MVTAANPPGQAKPQRRRLCIAVIAAVVLLVFILFLGVGHWLVVEDQLQKVDAIVVLSGRMPLRVLEAAKLYNAGYAKEVWLTHESETAQAMQGLGVRYVGEEIYNRQILIHEGVPTDAIRDLGPSIENTADEIRAVAQEMKKENRSAVIIVTSKVHTRRVRTLWQRLAGKNLHAVIRGASDDPFEAGHWWTTSRDALDVVREVLGLFNAWAGLPLRPRQQN